MNWAWREGMRVSKGDTKFNYDRGNWKIYAEWLDRVGYEILMATTWRLWYESIAFRSNEELNIINSDEVMSSTVFLASVMTHEK